MVRKPARSKPGRANLVDPEQRRQLIEACAFFRADRFRPVEPGHYRRQDLQDAEADIDSVLGRRGKRRKR